MSVHSLFTLLALVCFGAASVVFAVQKSWAAALFTAGVFCIVLAGGGTLIDD